MSRARSSLGLAGLNVLLRTDVKHVIYVANVHGSWDAALTNTLNRGDKILALHSGLFAAGWGEASKLLDLNVEVLPGTWRTAVDPDQLEARLKEDTDHEIKAILVVQVDTASGVWNDIRALRRAIDAAKHPALFMVDTIASLGCIPFDMDEWGIDVALTGSQTRLM